MLISGIGVPLNPFFYIGIIEHILLADEQARFATYAQIGRVIFLCF